LFILLYYELISFFFYLSENEETTECWYYTTEEQLHLLIDSLDSQMESVLFNEIQKIKDEIHRQMKITMDLTLQYRPSNRKTFLEIENCKYFVHYYLL
jgi:hypothetical protein